VTGEKFHFPVGYHQFHKDQVFNFQLNRWYSLGYARFEDMKEVGQRINTFEEWKTEMLKLAEKAVAEDRLLNSILYWVIPIKNLCITNSSICFTGLLKTMELKD
jgi:hypothetical protein